MARLIDSVLGQQEALKAIGLAASKGRLPQSMIFYGPQGVGKKKTAFSLAQALVCARPRNEMSHPGFDACGECGPCARIETGESESLLLIKPETRQIKIEQAKQIIDFLSLARMGKARVVIIEDAQALNPQAANSLLKVIEEPPPETYFFLLTPALRLLIPTLRSRSAVIRFAPISEAILTRIYGQSIASWAMGSFERAEKLKGWEGSQEALALADLQRGWLQKKPVYLSDSWLEIFKKRDRLQVLFEAWLFEVRDSLLSGSQAADSQGLHGHKLEEKEKVRLAERLIWALKELQTNRDPQLLFEQFWFESLDGRI